MDKNECTIIGQLIIKAPKSKYEMSELANVFLEQKSKAIADKLICEEFRANPTSEEAFMGKRNAAIEKIYHGLLGSLENKQEEMKLWA